MKHNKKIGIKWRLIQFLALFVAVIIASLWIFQTVFLEDFYRYIKSEELESAVNLIASAEDYDDIVPILNTNSICALVYNSRLARVASVHTGGNCLIHSVTDEYITSLLDDTLKNGGSYAAYFYSNDKTFNKNNMKAHIESDPMGNFFGNVFGDIFEPDDYSRSNEDSLLRCKVTTDAKGNDVFIITSALILPVDATAKAIKLQLIIITCVLAVLSVILAAYISRKVSAPIISLTKESKKLPNGDFKYTSPKNSYREIEELGHTLQYANEEISKVDSLRRELVSNVSHDLRTPLTLIAGSAEMMRDIPSEVTTENLQTIIDEAHRLSDLVSDLLDVSKIEAGLHTLSCSTFSFTELISDIKARYQTLIDKDKVSIEFEFDREVFACADKTKISQVVYNLINNAINYVGEDKKVIIRQTAKSGIIKLEVIDHGIGIPEDQLPDIWDRYYRVNGNHERASVGSGLGLSIVKKMLELHAADYGVISRLGEGSDFWFMIPEASSPDDLLDAQIVDGNRGD